MAGSTFAPRGGRQGFEIGSQIGEFLPVDPAPDQRSWVADFVADHRLTERVGGHMGFSQYDSVVVQKLCSSLSTDGGEEFPAVGGRQGGRIEGDGVDAVGEALHPGLFPSAAEGRRQILSEQGGSHHRVAVAVGRIVEHTHWVVGGIARVGLGVGLTRLRGQPVGRPADCRPARGRLQKRIEGQGAIRRGDDFAEIEIEV